MKILFFTFLILFSFSANAESFDDKTCKQDYITCLAKSKEKEFPKVEFPDAEKWNTFTDHSDRRIILEGYGPLYSNESYKFEGGVSYQLPNEEYKSDRDNSYEIKASISFAL